MLIEKNTITIFSLILLIFFFLKYYYYKLFFRYKAKEKKN
jgi:hypothetical protein